MSDIEQFVKQYADAIRADSAAVFAGAGLSIPAGLVDWRGLMRDIASDINLEVDKEDDLVTVAQYHVNERKGRNKINQALITEFAERAETTENHEILARLPIRTYWTTNYDTLIEQSLKKAGKRADVKTTEASLATTLPRRSATVYKMHGDVSAPEKAVVTRDDYERYQLTHHLFGTALQGDLVEKTFLFIGFSFSDPNLSYILSRIRLLMGENHRDHYALMRRVQRADFKTNDAFTYARARQDLQVRDLRRYGIHGLLLDSFAEYTDVLKRIEARVRRRRIFVSGSASTYAPLSDDDGQDLLRSIGYGIIEKGMDLVTGFGLGVGPFLLNGALERLESEGDRALHDRVTLRPFPQGVTDAVKRAERWQAYRRAMISEAGIAVFVFGNKANADGEIALAAGVEQEFEIARQQRLLLVPVGATGHMAEQLHARVMAAAEEFYPNKPAWREALAQLGQAADAETIVARTLALVHTMSHEA